MEEKIDFSPETLAKFTDKNRVSMYPGCIVELQETKRVSSFFVVVGICCCENDMYLLDSMSRCFPVDREELYLILKREEAITCFRETSDWVEDRLSKGLNPRRGVKNPEKISFEPQCW